MRPLNFRYKLLLLLLAVSAGAVLSVGLALGLHNRQGFEQEADQRFSAARRALIGRLQALEKQAQGEARAIAARPEVIATASLVFAYQSRQRYQPLVFDGEKKSLGQSLGSQLLAYAPGADQRVVTVFDGHGELVSFARAEGPSVQFGFLSYEGGKPVPYVSRPDADWNRAARSPETCAEEDPAALSASGYGQCAGRFMLRAVAPIERRFPSGAMLQVGRVVLSEQIGTEIANEIGEQTGTRLALYLHNRPLGGNLAEVDFDETLSRAAVPLLRDTSERHWRETARYLVQPYSIALGGALNAYVVVGVDKSGLNGQQQAIRDVVKQVLSAALALSIFLGLLLSWLFARPARRQAEHLVAIREGRARERLPVSGDAFGRLAGEAQEMAFALRGQAALQGSFERETARVAALEQAAQQMEAMVVTAVEAAEQRLPALAGHARGVARLAEAIGQAMGLPAEEVRGIRLGALVHDLGNVIVPAEFLNSPGELAPSQWEVVRGHAKAGYDLLKDLHGPWPVALMALQHHERMDGSGYPMGLSGEDILLAARVVAVADVVQAMVSPRPHRPALGVEKALEEIEAGRGTRYDARVVDACVELLRQEPELEKEQPR